jgi:hypothetical protein
MQPGFIYFGLQGFPGCSLNHANIQIKLLATTAGTLCRRAENPAHTYLMLSPCFRYGADMVQGGIPRA